MKALVASPGAPADIALADVDDPVAAEGQAVVAVRAVSLNRGEVRALVSAGPGWRPGWDVAGEVVVEARDGSGPRVGTRVVGLVSGGGWAERVAVPTGLLAPIPDELGFPSASTLPVAGLTASRALHVAGVMADNRVLVTGAAGGVGVFALQLAAHSGAAVTAVVGRPDRGAGLEALGAGEVVVGMPTAGDYECILESVGGASLAAALGLVAPGGIVVSYGSSSREATTFDASTFYQRSGARLYGFVLAAELARAGPGAGPADLARLALMAGSGRLQTPISLELGWDEAAAAVKALLDRQVTGKAVLLIG